MLIDNSNQGYVFGKNNVYQLGLSNTTNRSSPTQITYVSSILDASLDDNNFSLIDGGGNFWLAGTYNVSMVPAGPYNVTANSEINYSKVTTNSNNFILTRDNGTIWSFGVNTFGALGLNNTSPSFSPVQIGTINTPIKVLTTSNSTALMIK
jgi:alpha-tubulin suppressor-like RCC1 family protein